MKRTFALFLCVLLSFSVFAQKIKHKEFIGRVVDSSQLKAVGYATIQFMDVKNNKNEYGCISDSLGRIHFNKIACKEYQVVISCLGYKTKKLNLSIPSKGGVFYKRFKLQKAAINLDEVQIVGVQKGAKTMIDKTIYIPDSLSLATSKTGLDLLKKAPGITVRRSDQSIKVFGNSNVLILVDGVNSNRNINSIEPRDIERIEVVDNPSAKYDSDIANVINVILKEDRKKGLKVFTNLMYNHAKNYYSFNTAQVEYEFNKVRIFGLYKYNFNRHDFNDTTTITNIIGNDRYKALSYSLDNETKSNKHTFQYGIDYYINQRNLINFTGRYNNYQRNTFFNKFSEYTINSSLDYSSITNREVDNKYELQNYTLFYKHRFKAKNHELKWNTNVYIMDRDNDVNRDIVFSNQQPSSKRLYNKDVSKNISHTVNSKLDYSYPFNYNSQLDLGSQLYYRDIENDYQTSNSLSSFRYKDLRNALYGVYTFRHQKLSFQTGLRIESFSTSFSEQLDYQQLNYLPSASVLYKFDGKRSINLKLNQKLNYPRYHMLTPFTYYSSDSLTISTGNPDLKPEKFLNLELNYSYKKKHTYISTALYYKRFDDLIGLSYQLNDKNVKRVTYDNISYSDKYGAYLYLQGIVLGGLIQASLYNTVFYNVFPESKYNGFTYNAFLSMEVQMPFDMYLNVDASYAGKQYQFYGHSTENPIIDEISLTKSILRDKGELAIGLIEYFIPSISEDVIWKDSYKEKNVFVSDAKAIMIQFNYFFTKGKRLKKVKRELNMEQDTK